MTRITTLDLTAARARVKNTTSGYSARAPYREAIANLSAGRMLELEPDAGETLRGLKMSITRAAKEINRPVAQGESDSGTLLVWLEDAPKKTRRAKQG